MIQMRVESFVKSKNHLILEARLASFKYRFNLAPSAPTFLWILEKYGHLMMEQIKARYNIFLTSGITRAKQRDDIGAPITHDNTIYLM
jgi:hypothetical protein